MLSKDSKIPYICNSDKVVLFDGKCKLCNAWCRFIISHDKHHVFKVASMQSKKGQEILAYLKQPVENFETMLLIEDSKLYRKSNSFLKIVWQLPPPINLFAVFKVLPAFIRDFFYDYIAKNRYKFFGKHDTCVLPSAIHKDRYL